MEGWGWVIDEATAFSREFPTITTRTEPKARRESEVTFKAAATAAVGIQRMIDAAALTKFATDFLGTDAKYKTNWTRKGYRQPSLDPNDEYDDNRGEGEGDSGGGGGGGEAPPPLPTQTKPYWRQSIDIKPFSNEHGNQESPQAKQQAAFNAKLKLLQAGSMTSEKTLDSYTTRFVLGAGSFGSVLLVNDKKTKKVGALKIIGKARLVAKSSAGNIIHEKDILFAISGSTPFAVQMYDHFQDAYHVYISMEFCNGGELFEVQSREVGRKFNPNVCRFFAAEILLGLEYLHNLDVVFRDLKPENILLDYRGHCKLTDFGFAKRVKAKTSTLLGTPEYIAPEVIAYKSYGYKVDWWAYGVLFFEMRAGRGPFSSAAKKTDLFRLITLGDYVIPDDFTEDEKEVVEGLLEADEDVRWDAANLRKADYFDGVDWGLLAQQQYKSQFLPQVKDDEDPVQFRTEETDCCGRTKPLYAAIDVGWKPGQDLWGETFKNF